MPKKDIKLYVLNCGQLTTRGTRFFDAAGNVEKSDQVMAICCYLIDHPKGLLLWDTGVPDRWVSAEDGVVRSHGKFVYRVDRPLLEQLADYGYEPEDVTHVILSHLHVDHAGNLDQFPNAEIILQEAEYDFAFGEKSADWGYEDDVYQELPTRNPLLLDGEVDLFGDETVRLIPAPGHTPGHQILLLRLRKSGPLLLCADLFYQREDRQPRRFPIWNTNWPETLATIENVEQLVKDTEIKLLLAHDWKDWEKMQEKKMPLT